MLRKASSLQYTKNIKIHAGIFDAAYPSVGTMGTKTSLTTVFCVAYKIRQMVTPQTYFSAIGFLLFAADLAHIAGADGTQSDARRQAYDALGAARYILIRSHNWYLLSHQTATAALLALTALLGRPQVPGHRSLAGRHRATRARADIVWDHTH